MDEEMFQGAETPEKVPPVEENATEPTEDLEALADEVPGESDEADEEESEESPIETMRKMMLEFMELQKSKDGTTSSETPKETQSEPEYELSEDDYQSLGSREGAQKVFQQMMKKTGASIREGFLKEIPGIVNAMVAQQMMLHRAVGEFYQNNKDLAPYRGLVQTQTQQLSMAHKDWDLQKVLDEAGKATRKLLRIKAGATPSEGIKPKPGFPVGTPKKQKSSGKGNDFQKQVAEMFGK